MGWTTPVTWVDGNGLSAGELNTFLRDNMLQTMPALATGRGHFVTDGVNRLVERDISFAVTDTSEQTASTSYVDLSTIGPTVTVDTGNYALVWWGCYTENSVANAANTIGVAATGASSITASDDKALIVPLYTAAKGLRMSMPHMYDGLTPGTNTFTMKYKVDSGTGLFARRILIVIAL